MELLLGLLIAFVVAGGLVIRYWHQQGQVARLRDRARLKVIEGQMATLRASLRIQIAEHAARRQMQQNLFANSTIHEEPEQWQR
jgi:hypothetical protein